jgi:hypothetical protein
LDAEIKFLKPIDSFFFNTLRDKKSFVKTGAPDFSAPILDAAKNFFFQHTSDPDFTNFIFPTKKFTYWWINVPFYREIDMDDYYKYLRYDNLTFFQSTINWNTFDHMLYLNWLEYQRDFKALYALNVCHIEFSSEVWDVIDFWKIEKPFMLNHCHHKSLTSDKYYNKVGKIILDSVYVVIHLDRNCVEQDYSKNTRELPDSDQYRPFEENKIDQLLKDVKIKNC